MVLEQTEKLSAELDVRFAALVHDLGKATTQESDLPSHPGHEQRGSKLIKKLSERLPLPKASRDLGMLVAEYHTHCHRATELKEATIVKVLETTDAFRRPDRFEKFLLACEADARGRTGLEHRDYPQADYLRGAYAAAATVDAASIAATNQASDIATAIRKARVSAVARYCQTAR